ncbi:MAG: DUF4430 domain-containing protein [Candidatus Paceibacterota bacterium]
MSKLTTKNKIIIITLLAFLSVSFLFFYGVEKQKIILPQEKVFNNASNTENTQSTNIKTILEINDKRYEGTVLGITNVYDFMDKLRSEGKINFTEKNYAGIGKFIVSINGIKGNGEKNWIYYVNGIKAQIGVSDYKIKGGDVVSWKYEKFNY